MIPVSRATANALFACLLAVIAVTYSFGIDLRGIWGDEALRIRAINGVDFLDVDGTRQHGSMADLLWFVKEHTNYQPLYYVLQHGLWLATGSMQDTLLRLTNVALLCINCFLLWWITGGFRSLLARLATILCFAWGQTAFMHTMQLREYQLLLCCMLSGTMLFFWNLERKDDAHWKSLLFILLYGLHLGMAFYTHLWALFFTVLHWGIAVLPSANRRRQLWSMVLSWWLLVPMLVPWLHKGRFFSGKVDVGQWEPGPYTLERFAGAMLQGLQSLIAGNPTQPLSSWQVLHMLAILGLLACAAWYRKRLLRHPRALYGVLCCAAFFCFQAGYFFLRDGLSIWIRYFIPYLLFLAYFVGLGMDWLTTRTPWRRAAQAVGAGILGVMVISGALQVQAQYEDPFFDAGYDLRAATRLATQYVRPDETIIISHEVTFYGIAYYWPWEAPVVLATPWGPQPLPTELKLGQRAAHIYYSDGVITDHTKRVFQYFQNRGYALTHETALDQTIYLQTWESPSP